MNWKRILAFMTLAAAMSIPAVAQTTNSTATPGINHRQRHQQRRIKQGVQSGQLNAAETRRLEHQERHIQRTKTRAKADGTVTAKERAHIRHEENRTSRHIYRQKHDAQTQTK